MPLLLLLASEATTAAASKLECRCVLSWRGGARRSYLVQRSHAASIWLRPRWKAFRLSSFIKGRRVRRNSKLQQRETTPSSKEGRPCVLRRCLRDLTSKSKFLKLHSGNLETLLENENLSSHVLKREVSAPGISASLSQSLSRLRHKRGLETTQEMAIGRRG